MLKQLFNQPLNGKTEHGSKPYAAHEGQETCNKPAAKAT